MTALFRNMDEKIRGTFLEVSIGLDLLEATFF